eukprot:GHRR01027962.1.p1 GENE.GHRR01027962.1~~GHRR01027962.1.p1  ORF type:complete len:147 (+),score=27.52 GHRR01027962.1:581-1021(+)
MCMLLLWAHGSQAAWPAPAQTCTSQMCPCATSGWLHCMLYIMLKPCSPFSCARLCWLRASRYVERLQGSLQRKAGQEAKMLAAAAETQARKQESRAALAGIQPKLAEVVDCTRKIKKAVEAALSKQFNGRHINVLGEINNALTLTS